MQVYRRLRIATARPTAAETGDTPYHLIDCLDPLDAQGREQRFSAAEFVRRAEPILDALHARGKTPLVVGGTGLYLQALTQGLFEHPAIDPAARRAVEAELAALSPEQAHALLCDVDPESADRIHPHDRIRLVRALEIFRATGQTASHWRRLQREQADALARRRPSVCFVLNMPRRKLYERINQRAERMFDEGLIEETRDLLAQGLTPGMHCMRALGYDRIMAHLAGEADLDVTRAALAQAHRNYAKRQLTWFRKVAGACWVSADDRTAEEMADVIENTLASQMQITS